MSTVLNKDKQQGVEKGVEGFADEIRDLLAFSEVPQTYQDIRDHFEGDDNYLEQGGNYFEEDLEYVREALIHLQDQDKVKQDFRLDEEGIEDAYSISDYNSI